MKKPFLDLEQRQIIRLGTTTTGSILKFNIALKKCYRELEKPLKDLLNVF